MVWTRRPHEADGTELLARFAAPSSEATKALIATIWRAPACCDQATVRAARSGADLVVMCPEATHRPLAAEAKPCGAPCHWARISAPQLEDARAAGLIDHLPSWYPEALAAGWEPTSNAPCYKGAIVAPQILVYALHQHQLIRARRGDRQGDAMPIGAQGPLLVLISPWLAAEPLKGWTPNELWGSEKFDLVTNPEVLAARRPSQVANSLVGWADSGGECDPVLVEHLATTLMLWASWEDYEHFLPSTLARMDAAMLEAFDGGKDWCRLRSHR